MLYSTSFKGLTHSQLSSVLWFDPQQSKKSNLLERKTDAQK